MQRGYAIANSCYAMAIDVQVKKRAKSMERVKRLKQLRETPTEVTVNKLMKILEGNK